MDDKPVTDKFRRNIVGFFQLKDSDFVKLWQTSTSLSQAEKRYNLLCREHMAANGSDWGEEPAPALNGFAQSTLTQQRYNLIRHNVRLKELKRVSSKRKDMAYYKRLNQYAQSLA